MSTIAIEQDLLCFHCGQSCPEEAIWLAEKSFCCHGCQTVFEILNSNNLCEYYSLEKAPGIPISKTAEQNFLYLDESTIRKKLLTFDSLDLRR